MKQIAALWETGNDNIRWAKALDRDLRQLRRQYNLLEMSSNNIIVLK